jgi:formylglycine-generating enzyme required for sulfatase activity
MYFRYMIFFLMSLSLFSAESLDWSKAKQVNDTFVNQMGIKLTYIPAGTFMMGSPEGEPNSKEGDVLHKVTLTQSFFQLSSLIQFYYVL